MRNLAGLFLLFFPPLLPGQGAVPPTTTAPWLRNPVVNGALGTDWAYIHLMPHPGSPGLFLASHTTYVGNIPPDQGGVGHKGLVTGIYDAVQKRFIPDTPVNLARDLNTCSQDSCLVLLPGGPNAGLRAVYEWFDGAMGDTWVFGSTSQQWTQLGPKTSPPRRYRHAMAYMGDAVQGRTILFGGSTFTQATNHKVSYLNDTWSWDGKNWMQLTPKTAPSPRDYHAMVYDLNRKKIVLFGGWDGSRYLGDTWEFDGVNWTSIQPAGSPGSRYASDMAYDPVRKRVVLFGGHDGTNYLNDTWEYDATKGTWTNVTPATQNPPVRSRHAMAYDAARGHVVLFGGLDDGSAALQDPNIGRRANRTLGDTWAWNGKAWTLLAGAGTTFHGRCQFDMAYDPISRKIDFFGGFMFSNIRRDHGQWDGRAWSELMTLQTPPLSCTSAQGPYEVGRSDHAMTYDAARGQMVLFGGSGKPYRFTNNPPRTCCKVMLAWRPSLTSPWQIVGPIVNMPFTLQAQECYDPAIAYYEFEKGKQELVLLFTSCRTLPNQQVAGDLVMAPLDWTRRTLDMSRVQVLVRATQGNEVAQSANAVVDSRGNLIGLNFSVINGSTGHNDLHFAADLDPATAPLCYHLAGPPHHWNNNPAYAGGTFFAGELVWPGIPWGYRYYEIRSRDAVWWTGGRAWPGTAMDMRVHTPIGENWLSLVLVGGSFVSKTKPFSIPGALGSCGLSPAWLGVLTPSRSANPATGRTTWALPVPTDPVLKGAVIPGQCVSVRISRNQVVLGNTGALTIR